MSGIEPARIEAFHVGPFDDRHPPRSPIKLWVFFDTLRCAIYPAGLAQGFNGYVQLPEDSVDRLLAEVYDNFEQERQNDPDYRDRFGPRRRPWSALGYQILSDLQVHGSLTYGPDEQGWVGFDTGHAGDDWSDAELERHLNTAENHQVWLQLQRMWEMVGRDSWPPGRVSRSGPPLRWDRDWTIELLIEETEALAAQVYERLRGAGVLNGV